VSPQRPAAAAAAAATAIHCQTSSTGSQVSWCRLACVETMTSPMTSRAPANASLVQYAVFVVVTLLLIAAVDSLQTDTDQRE